MEVPRCGLIAYEIMLYIAIMDIGLSIDSIYGLKMGRGF